MKRSWMRLVPLFLPVGLFLVALTILHHELGAWRWSDFERALADVSPMRIAAAAVLTATSYAALTAYDALAVRYVGKKVPIRRTTFAGLVGFAFAHSSGLPLLSGGVVRIRLYRAWGFTVEEVTKLLLFVSATTWLGFVALTGALLAIAPPSPGARFAGIALLLVVALFLWWSARKGPALRIRTLSITPPTLSIACSAVAVGVIDWLCAAAALGVLLPGNTVPWARFTWVFLVAQIGGILSQVPAGIGIFDSAVLLGLRGGDITATTAALVAYRATYYLLPFLLAVAALGIWEVSLRSKSLRSAAGTLAGLVPSLMPDALAGAAFVAGVILLLSGVTPAGTGRLAMLSRFVPLPVVELSHVLGAVVGVCLLVVARGLQRRLDGAWLVACGLLAAGALASLLKGFDWEEALLLGAILVALVGSRRHFFRRSALVAERLSAKWTAALSISLAGVAWIWFVAWRHAPLSVSSLGAFSLHDEAARTARALLTAGIAIPFAWLLAPARLAPATANAEETDLAAAIAAKAGSTTANLVLLGDKRLLFSGHKDAFIMYGAEGGSLVAMGDPVGPEERWTELIRSFQMLAYHLGKRPVFYQAGSATLHHYADAGLALFKLGEEAVIPLDVFTLEGSSRKELRYVVRKLEREGLSFEILPVEKVPAVMDELEAVSDGWLADKHVREKGFSLGFFDRAYLARFPVALIRNSAGALVAFANVWTSAGKEELSIDLMRHTAGAPNGIMDYLLIRLFLWGRAEGYARFNLGMAPLSGLSTGPLAPAWSKVAGLAYLHGEAFYGFQGLRAWKSKFTPVWEARYLACPSGLGIPGAVANVTSLVSGGMKGIFTS